ncbi:MAG: tRNA (cytidine/uridine-2-O-)-methyltransferase [Chthoniobacter sp.]|nr:tRNA (cytidine/uridine-2-O-)-methyltransferase [Chthoniobacter sp.]
MFNIVLVEPEIPANTGNIARTCLATGARLHLVAPLGFSLDDRQLRRAGLDYWHEVDVTTWDSLDALFAATAAHAARRFFLTTKSDRPYFDAQFQDGDWLLFGRETKGLPEPLLAQHADQILTIPMTNQTRSLNLSVSVGIVLFEAIRQLR